MLLQTNSYIVPKDRRTEHARLLQRFRQLMHRLGCDHFEVYEQVGTNWSGSDGTGRFVQILRFRDRQHYLAVQAAEKADPQAGGLIKEFCDLINLPYQQQAGLFAAGYYQGVIVPAFPAGPAAGRSVAAAVGAAAGFVAAGTTADAAPEDAIPAIDPVPDAGLSEPDSPAPSPAADANGEVDVLEYLDQVEPHSAPADSAEHQRID